MAIINRTSDSFYSDNRHADLDSAKAALRLRSKPVPTSSTSAGSGRGRSEQVSAEQELERVLPFLEHARAEGSPTSSSASTPALRGGFRRAASGSTSSSTGPGTTPSSSRSPPGSVPESCLAPGGLPPRTDPRGVTYPPEPTGVVRDVIRTLAEGAQRAEQAGIPADRILVDPTPDFGKTTALPPRSCGTRPT